MAKPKQTKKKDNPRKRKEKKKSRSIPRQKRKSRQKKRGIKKSIRAGTSPAQLMAQSPDLAQSLAALLKDIPNITLADALQRVTKKMKGQPQLPDEHKLPEVNPGATLAYNYWDKYGNEFQKSQKGVKPGEKLIAMFFPYDKATHNPNEPTDTFFPGFEIKTNEKITEETLKDKFLSGESFLKIPRDIYRDIVKTKKKDPNKDIKLLPEKQKFSRESFIRWFSKYTTKPKLEFLKEGSQLSKWMEHEGSDGQGRFHTYGTKYDPK